MDYLPLRRGLRPIGGIRKGGERKGDRLGQQCLQVSTDNVDELAQSVEDFVAPCVIGFHLENGGRDGSSQRGGAVQAQFSIPRARDFSANGKCPDRGKIRRRGSINLESQGGGPCVLDNPVKISLGH